MSENINNETENLNVELTAGEMLRNARTTGRRKREIQTVAKQLCIREEFLQALESGDYAAIPETVYILGFARNYAMELGVDPDEIVTKIKREMGMIPDAADADVDAGTTQNVPRVSGKARVMQYLRKYWKFFALGLALFVVLILVMVFAFGGSGNVPTDGSDVTAAELVQPIAEPEYNLDVRERFGVENRNNADVILQSVQESWVKVEDARGNTVFSRVLVPGDVYYVPAGGDYRATFGNAGGVDIWVNGTLAAKAGPAHTRKSGISLNPETLAATAPAAPTDTADTE